MRPSAASTIARVSARSRSPDSVAFQTAQAAPPAMPSASPKTSAPLCDELANRRVPLRLSGRTVGAVPVTNSLPSRRRSAKAAPPPSSLRSMPQHGGRGWERGHWANAAGGRSSAARRSLSMTASRRTLLGRCAMNCRETRTGGFPPGAEIPRFARTEFTAGAVRRVDRNGATPAVRERRRRLTRFDRRRGRRRAPLEFQGIFPVWIPVKVRGFARWRRQTSR